MPKLISLIIALVTTVTALAQTNIAHLDSKMSNYNLVDITTLEGGEDILV